MMDHFSIDYILSDVL